MDDRPAHLDLFSGIGGFSIAAGWAGYRTIGFSETDPFCCRLLEERFPGIPNYGDIRNFDQWDIEGPVDLLTGGFPCQPYSVAGKRRGSEDDRHLWPEMFRVISEIRPRWVVGENVAGIIPMELDQVLSDLEGSAYETQAFVIPACAVDAPHRRDRVWIVAHSESDGREQTGLRRQIASGIGLSGEDVADSEKERRRQGDSDGGRPGYGTGTTEKRRGSADCCRLSGKDVADSPITRLEGTAGTGIQRGIGRPAGFSAWLAESRMGRMADGVSAWMDEPEDIPRVAKGVEERGNRLKALGNSIVPAVAYEILRSIREIGH